MYIYIYISYTETYDKQHRTKTQEPTKGGFRRVTQARLAADESDGDPLAYVYL